MEIIGGSSYINTVTLITETHTATASIGKNRVSVEVAKTDEKLVAYSREKSRQPQVVRLLRFLWQTTGKNGRAAYIALVLLSLVTSMWRHDTPLPAQATWYLDAWSMVTKVVLYGGIWALFWLIGPWHAAEHKVIAAIREHGNDITYERMQAANRIDPWCGGRFVAPVIALSYALSAATSAMGLWFPGIEWVPTLLAFEAVLWLDVLVGIHEIAPLRWCSETLQRYVTTREPGPNEHLTAWCAMSAIHNAAQKRYTDPHRVVFTHDGEQWKAVVVQKKAA